MTDLGTQRVAHAVAVLGYPLDGREFRYACYARVPGSAPGMELPDVGAATARSLAAQAVQRLDVLHGWAPSGPAARTLSEPVDHGGFVSRAALLAEAEAIAAADRNSVVPSALAGCEVRHAAHLASDIRLGLAHPDRSARLLTHRLSRLTQVVVERIWWRAAR